MKLFEICFLFVAVSCHSQIDLVDSDTVFLNETLSINSSREDVINQLGLPMDIAEEYWEMDEATVEVIAYEGITIYIKSNRIVAFEITAPQYNIKIHGIQVSVGNSIRSLSTSFPLSYNYASNGNMAIGLDEGDYSYILIKYDSQNIITRIQQRFY